MDIEAYIEKIENNVSQELLINPDTGDLWAVDHYALREHGYPEGGWMLLEDVSKAVLVKLAYKLRGMDSIED